MPEKVERSDEVRPDAPPPGTITGLLRQIAEAPDAALGEGWARGLEPGAVVGRFELVREIGRGGFGVVYEARDRELGRAVAFKAVRAGERAALREERLVREAEAAARLSHPNIVTLHDVGRCEHGPYLVLELLRGETLADRLDRGPTSVREALRICVEVARGLAYAHEQGVVHRDLKPANVFLCEDGQVKLLDFGLAHALGRRRMDGGTPAYMAPEQWRGAPEDERTDVFALGVLLYRTLAGELPFGDGDGAKALASQKPAPGLDVPEAPALGAFVGRMLAKDPVDRPRDGGAALAALASFQRELDRTPSSPAPVRTRRRFPRTLALSAAAAAVAAAALFVWLRRQAVPPETGAPIAVVVADFANQTGEPELDGLSGMLITSLEQSQRLTVLTRVRMLDLLRQLGKAGVATVDEALGREVALAAGARALVLASIRRFDRIYAMEMKVLDPVTSEYLFTLKEEARGKSSVPSMIDRLSEQTRERLRYETAAEVQASKARIADLTTGSLEAYQHYFHGEQLKEAVRYDDAVEEYRKAIAADPTFALAHYRIAYLGKFTGLDDAYRGEEMDAALRNADRVPAKERLLIQAWKAVMDGRSDDAKGLYARAVAAHPQDKEVLFMAGDQLLHEERYAEALPFFERALALDPTFEPALMHASDSLAKLGRMDELEALGRRSTERAPSAAGYRALAEASVLRGDMSRAVDAARRALDLDGAMFSRSGLAACLVFAERYEEAEALVRPFASATASGFDRRFALPVLALALAYEGRTREALRALGDAADDGARTSSSKADEYRRERDLMRFEILLGNGPAEDALRSGRALYETARPLPSAATGLAFLGDFEWAAKLAEKLPPPGRQLYEAAVAWRRGDPRGALATARELAASTDHEVRGPALWMIVRISHELSDSESVVSAAGALRRTAGGAWRTWGFPQSLYFAAVAHERRGERAKARADLDDLLRIWKRADSDVPMLAEAKALRRRLGAGL